jgi:hypothetical protein
MRFRNNNRRSIAQVRKQDLLQLALRRRRDVLARLIDVVCRLDAVLLHLGRDGLRLLQDTKDVLTGETSQVVLVPSAAEEDLELCPSQLAVLLRGTTGTDDSRVRRHILETLRQVGADSVIITSQANAEEKQVNSTRQSKSTQPLTGHGQQPWQRAQHGRPRPRRSPSQCH